MILTINEAVIVCNKLKKIDLGIGNKYLEKILKSKKEEPCENCDIQPAKVDVKQPLKQAVLCETQEQWDFILSKIKQNVLTTKDYLIYTNRTCWTLFDNCCATTQLCEENDVQILSFSDWCVQNNYEFQSKATSLKNMFDFNVSEQTANNISETIDRVRYRAMRTAQTETLDEMFCASIDEVSKSLDNYTSELPTHAIGDGWGFVLHSNLLTVPKSYKSYCRSTRVLASPLRGFNVLILTMQIYNKYFNLPNYFAFFCRLHPTHVKTISGFYAPFYKNKIQISTDNEIKINIIQKQSIKI